MATQAGICSAASVSLGGKAITSLTDDGTLESEAANALYASARDSFLSGWPWRFATKPVSLTTPSVTAPAADWLYAFSLPSDALRVVSVGAYVESGRNYTGGADYAIVDGQIVTDLPKIVLEYVYRKSESSWPAYAEIAMIAVMMDRLCLPITGSISNREKLAAAAERAIRKAARDDRDWAQTTEVTPEVISARA